MCQPFSHGDAGVWIITLHEQFNFKLTAITSANTFGRTLKAKYDPMNLFHLNQNIFPDTMPRA